MNKVKFVIERDTFAEAKGAKEGYTLGKIYCEGQYYGNTLEDEDRHLEEGGIKIPGKTAMPCGNFRLALYDSPKHGTVPLFLGVPQFTFTEIHRANHAEELLGCVAVGTHRTEDGVADCQKVLTKIIERMKLAAEEGDECWCEIRRKE